MTNNYMAGLTQSQAVTVAAQKLSRLKEAEKASANDSNVTAAQREVIARRVAEAKQEYRTAFLAYTNPFNVNKNS